MKWSRIAAVLCVAAFCLAFAAQAFATWARTCRDDGVASKGGLRLGSFGRRGDG